MALRKLKHRRTSAAQPRILITSMMDMFTIILIFLLFSFSDKPEHMALDQELDLPISTAKGGYTDSVKLVLSKNALKLGDEVLSEIENGRIIGFDPKKPKTSLLYKRLMQTRETTLLEEETSGMDNDISKKHILFLCDKNHSFKIINNITKTAGLAGYPNFQFAVFKQ